VNPREPACTTPVALASVPASASELRKREESVSATGPDPWRSIRLLKQTLGWTRPKIRTPEAADRWTWLAIAAHTQLRLARPLAEDLRRPWERPARPGRLTPARVRRGFRNIRPNTALPARVPKPTRPGPGRPLGSRNRQPTPSHDVGKTVKRDRTITERQQRTG
jgi:hypothetical protein